MKIKLTGFIVKSPYKKGFSFCEIDMSASGYLNVCKVDTEIEVDIPADWNPITAEVAMLKKKREEIIAEKSQQVMVIDKRINDLLCIENVVPA